MILKNIYLLLLTAAVSSVYSQTDGYWDKERITSREIVVPAGNRVVIKTEDFPVGTTQVVYRITILDENQQLASSLVSLLKAVPDPTGISQGSAGAVFILSKVSGDDKCRYGIFTSSEYASRYKENGTTDKACLYQDTPVNKEVKVLSAEKLACLNPNSTNLWFGFESNNWILKQKIVLEVVPWVDNKLSRGWNVENKKVVLNLCKTSDLAKKLPDPDDFCLCILDKFQSKYRFPEYQKLLAAEKAKGFRDFGNTCLNETGAYSTIYNALRNQSTELMEHGKYGEAISNLLVIVNEGKATALDYNALGTNYILTKQYDKAIKFLKDGERADDSELLIKLNLAHAFMFNGNLKQSKAIHKKYHAQNVTDALSWKQKVTADFDTFRKANLPTDNFDNITAILD